jgi:hypothetical protein
MQTFNVIVLDFVSSVPSPFIEAIELAYAEPIKANKRTSLEEQKRIRDKYRGIFAAVRIRPGQTDEVALHFFLAPSRKENEDTEAVWEILMEGAGSVVAILPPDSSQMQTNAKPIIQQFRSYAPVPLVLMVETHLDTYVADTLASDLGLPDETLVMAYESLSAALLGKLIARLDDLAQDQIRG